MKLLKLVAAIVCILVFCTCEKPNQQLLEGGDASKSVPADVEFSGKKRYQDSELVIHVAKAKDDLSWRFFSAGWTFVKNAEDLRSVFATYKYNSNMSIRLELDDDLDIHDLRTVTVVLKDCGIRQFSLGDDLLCTITELAKEEWRKTPQKDDAHRAPP
jgi:hypothetical protein